MTANEKRRAVAEMYRKILGRNRYSQALRDYCYRKYRDGLYYSDCSSSICYAYKEAGIPFGILNTVGMYQSGKLRQVDVKIVNGVPQDVGKLRVGDMLLFAGNDSSRGYAGFVGHVEMVGEIDGGKVTLYGHGSGTPSKKDMAAYCKKRQNTKANTSRGNRGLIKVVRFIQDDDRDERPEDDSMPVVTVKDVQGALIALGYPLPEWGADGEYGPETAAAIKAFQRDHGMAETGEIDNALIGAIGLRQARAVVTGESVFVRSAPMVDPRTVLGVVKQGRELVYQGADKAGFHLVEYAGQNAWISGRFSEIR